MYTCISMKDWRDLHVGMLASEAFLGQKQSHSSYMARGAYTSNFGCPRTHLLSRLTLNNESK